MDLSFIARIAHEADRTLAAINGDMTVGGWPHLQAWERTSAIAGVRQAVQTRGVSAEVLHEAWRRDKIEAGWTHGPHFDLSGKADPLLLPWHLLTPLQRLRDALFLGVVCSLSPE